MKLLLILSCFFYLSSAYATRTVEDVISLYGPAAEARLRPDFVTAGVQYPPRQIALLGFKLERRLELWAWERERWHYIRTFRMEGASGRPGPKLREGDRQVPEGIYRLISFNPNSSFHLSLEVNYPNAHDRQQARLENRSRLGGDIFIHGKSSSIGCIAIGDRGIEELFTLVYRTGLENVELIVAPHDFRWRMNRPVRHDLPLWVDNLYSDLKRELSRFYTPGAPLFYEAARPTTFPVIR